VRGVVHDSSGAAIPDAVIYYMTPGSDAGQQGAVTDSSGQFGFAVRQPGSYSIIAIFGGVIWGEKRITLPADSARLLEFLVPRCALTGKGICFGDPKRPGFTAWPPNKRMDAAERVRSKGMKWLCAWR